MKSRIEKSYNKCLCDILTTGVRVRVYVEHHTMSVAYVSSKLEITWHSLLSSSYLILFCLEVICFLKVLDLKKCSYRLTGGYWLNQKKN